MTSNARNLAVRQDQAIGAVAASLPSWSLTVTERGEPNSYFDAEAAARKLVARHREALPALIERASSAVAAPTIEQLRPLKRDLAKIGARITTTASDDAADAWASALLDSFAAIPIDILTASLARARLKQFRFVGDVGPWIEDDTSEDIARRRRIVARLKEMQMHAARIEREKSALPAPGNTTLTAAEIEQIKREAGLETAPEIDARRAELIAQAGGDAALRSAASAILKRGRGMEEAA